MLQRFLLATLVALSVPAAASRDRAEDAYQGARRYYYALKRDTNRRKFRHNWLNVATRFESVAKRFPKSPRSPDALFTAAELLSNLSRISMLDEDLKGAVDDYQRLIDQHPHHRLADDAALALGRIEAERRGDAAAARKALTRGLELNPHGDCAKKMKTLLASLGDVELKPSPRHVNAPANAPVKQAITADAVERPSAPANAPAPVAARASPAKTDAAADDDDDADATEESPPATPAPVTKQTARQRLKAVARSRGADSEITLAEQLGLKVRKVVIDAGHGGHDSGAVGPSGTLEKNVSLAIARKLADILGKQGLEVVLTRDDDTFVRLEDRAKIANEAKGDLFVSIHCNSAPTKKLRGIETYTLNTSSNRYSIRLAARENSSSEKGISDLQFILADLATKANTEESGRLATRIQHSLGSRISTKYPGTRDLGTKEALFYVLLGAKMPAVLVETSFLSNPDEEKRLASSGYQGELAESVAQGIVEFLGNRQHFARVDRVR